MKSNDHEEVIAYLLEFEDYDGTYWNRKTFNLTRARLMIYSGTPYLPRNIITLLINETKFLEYGNYVYKHLSRLHLDNCLINPKYLSNRWKQILGHEFLDELKNYQSLYPDNYRIDCIQCM